MVGENARAFFRPYLVTRSHPRKRATQAAPRPAQGTVARFTGDSRVLQVLDHGSSSSTWRFDAQDPLPHQRRADARGMREPDGAG
jgi:hypothetical protein